MTRTLTALIVSIGVFLLPVSHADQSGRPATLTLSSFQFGPDNRWAFSHLREVLPTVNIARDPGEVHVLEPSKERVTTFTVSFEGREQTIDQIADNHFIDGLLVLKDGKIAFEKYYGHLTPEKPHLMNSISKSVVALVAARLADQGVVDLNKKVSDYVPALIDSGYGPDSLQTVLDMRDGSNYTEDYADFSTTFRLQDCAIGWTAADYCPEGGPIGLYEFLPTIGRDEKKLGKFSYRSGSTNVIGWVLEEATGQPLAELISEHVWRPMGAEYDANITVDQSGMVLADHGMSSTLRDLSRLGLLILNKGRVLDRQVVPAAFIADLHNQPGDPAWPYEPGEGLEPYYRSFWWGEGNKGRDLSGVGIHGQIIRVAPEAGLVIALFSTWPRADGDGTTHGWEKAAELQNAIIERFD